MGEDELELADGLITLAAKIPSDLAKTLSHKPEAVRFLRSIGDEVWPSEEWQKDDGRPAIGARMTTNFLSDFQLEGTAGRWLGHNESICGVVARPSGAGWSVS